MSDHIENLMTSRKKTSLYWGVHIEDTAQKLDRMEQSFKVKHHTRAPDFLSFFSGTTGATKFKKVAQTLNKTKLFVNFILSLAS